jgi:hypothetical protein
MGHISFWSMLMAICYLKTNIVKQNAEAMLDASWEVGLRVNAEKEANKSFENMAGFEYLE